MIVCRIQRAIRRCWFVGTDSLSLLFAGVVCLVVGVRRCLELYSCGDLSGLFFSGNLSEFYSGGDLSELFSVGSLSELYSLELGNPIAAFPFLQPSDALLMFEHFRAF